jgi:hypothetical protein
MKKCFHSVLDYGFILSRDQSIPGDCLFFLALGVGPTERLSLFYLQGYLPGSWYWTNRETFLVFSARLSPWLSVLD